MSRHAHRLPEGFRHRLRWLVAVLALAATVLSGCGGEPVDASPAVVVGYGSTTEQRVLAALTVVALERAGVPVEVRPDLGDTQRLRRTALRGDIDVFWDYTGAAWALGLGQQAPPADPEESFQRVREADRANDLTWLEPTRANATLALFVREADVPAEGPPTLTWLSSQLSTGDAALCADPAFISRSGGLEALAVAYSISLEQMVAVPATEAEAIAAVADGRCLAGLATATSGAARNAGLVPVVDDLGVFPAFVVAPVVRAAALERTPALEEALRGVTELLDSTVLAELNARVEAGTEPGELAAGVLPVVGTPTEG